MMSSFFLQKISLKHEGIAVFQNFLIVPLPIGWSLLNEIILVTHGVLGPDSSLATISYVLPGITECCGKQSEIWLV